MPTLLVVVSIFGLLMTAGLLFTVQRLRRVLLELKTLKMRIDSVGSDLNALCSGTVGVDRRIVVLESQSRRFELRQESLENQKKDERPYGEAIQMVHKGATAESLVGKLGLSRSEAELVVMLHGVRKAS